MSEYLQQLTTAEAAGILSSIKARPPLCYASLLRRLLAS